MSWRLIRGGGWLRKVRFFLSFGSCYLRSSVDILGCFSVAWFEANEVNRAQTSSRGSRSSKEAQASPRRPRLYASGQNRQGSWSQAHQRCDGGCHPGRVSPSQQDSVPAGPPRHGGPGESYCCFWTLRGIPGGQIGAGQKGNCVRRVRERVWRYQCQGGYLGDAYGGEWQADSGYLPETISCADVVRAIVSNLFWRWGGVYLFYYIDWNSMQSLSFPSWAFILIFRVFSLWRLAL